LETFLSKTKVFSKVDSKEELNPSSQVKGNGKGELEPVISFGSMAVFPLKQII
jgi:hypothetical protein